MLLLKQLRRLKHVPFSVRLKFWILVLGGIWFLLYTTRNKANFPAVSLLSSRIDSNNPIFFVETSGRTTISLRMACVIESAAILHPSRLILVYSISPLATNHPNTEKLKLLSNIRFEVLHLESLFKGTPLQKWHQSGILKFSLHPTEHLSDAVRLAILWSVGGTYLDTDMLVVKPLDDFNNALGCGLNGTAGNNVLIFQKKHKFIFHCMAKFTSGYSTDSYDNQGPVLVTEVLRAMCDGHPKQIQDVVNRPDQCHGVILLPPFTFFAFGWQQWQHLFSNRGLVDISASHAVHLYAKMTKHVKARLGTDTLWESLALQHCPNTFLRMAELDKL